MSANKQAGLARFGKFWFEAPKYGQTTAMPVFGIQWCSSRLMVVVVLDM